MPTGTSVSLLSVFISAGLLIVAVAIPMALRKVPPNALYGLRVEATLTDKGVWYEANARSGRDLILVGVVFAGLAVVLSFVGLSEATFSIVCSAFLVIALIGAAIRGWLFAERLRRDRPSGPGSPGAAA